MTEKQPTAPITDLLKEISNFEPELFPPMDEVCAEHDTVLGSCPEELRRFYSFARYCERELKQLQVEREFSSEKDPTINARIFQWDKKRGLVRSMLWFALWEHFAAYRGGCGISLAKDWSVVLTEQQDGPGLPPFLAGLFGPQR